IEPGLSAAQQLDIDLGQETAIDIGAVLLADREIDRKTAAQRIEAGRRAREAAAREGERVNKGTGQGRAAKPRQFGIDKGEIEFGIVNNEPVAADKSVEIVGNSLKPRVARQETRR